MIRRPPRSTLFPSPTLFRSIRATQGDMPVISEPYAPAARELGITTEALLEHLEQMKERSILRRVAAILFHRRAGDRKSTRLNSSHANISYAVFCLNKKYITS